MRVCLCREIGRLQRRASDVFKKPGKVVAIFMYPTKVECQVMRSGFFILYGRNIHFRPDAYIMLESHHFLDLVQVVR